MLGGVAEILLCGNVPEMEKSGRILFLVQNLRTWLMKIAGKVDFDSARPEWNLLCRWKRFGVVKDYFDRYFLLLILFDLVYYTLIEFDI